MEALCLWRRHVYGGNIRDGGSSNRVFFISLSLIFTSLTLVFDQPDVDTAVTKAVDVRDRIMVQAVFYNLVLLVFESSLCLFFISLSLFFTSLCLFLSSLSLFLNSPCCFFYLDRLVFELALLVFHLGMLGFDMAMGLGDDYGDVLKLAHFTEIEPVVSKTD